MSSNELISRELEESIRKEQIDILYRHAPLTQATNVVVMLTVIWFLWGDLERERLLGWGATVLFIVFARLGLVYAYRNRAPDSRVAWHTWMTSATIGSGLAWGAAGILFYVPHSAPGLTFVTVILAGMAAGSIPSHSSWPAAQLGYAIPTMLPIAVFYLLGEGDLRVLGLMCLVFLANVVLFARQLSRSLLESLRLRLENQVLVERLRVEMAAAQSAQLRAEEANMAKSKFLAAASHDLRQPLHSMNLFVEALRNESDSARIEKVIEHLGASSRALEELLNELLDISKLEADLFEPQCKPIELQSMFDALEKEMRPVADEKGIELGFVRTRLNVLSDPSMLGRILRNLITNAIRYTDHGAVLVGCRRIGRDRVALAVYDTGLGIAPQHHQAIFREFFQLGNPERDRRKGLGLGLAIVDGLCRVLGHRLQLKSEPGRGSAFFVEVPITTEAALPGIGKAESETLDVAGCAILLIDDEPTNNVAMSELLGRWGCDVMVAESAAEALQRLAAMPAFVPDVIIADYRLRDGHTGADAIAQVRRALKRPVPAAIVTGDTAPERLLEATASGFQLLHKPLQPERLRSALHALYQQEHTTALLSSSEETEN